MQSEVSPAASEKPPPSPTSPLPKVNDIDPPAPPVASPVTKLISPADPPAPSPVRIALTPSVEPQDRVPGRSPRCRRSLQTSRFRCSAAIVAARAGRARVGGRDRSWSPESSEVPAPLSSTLAAPPVLAPTPPAMDTAPTRSPAAAITDASRQRQRASRGAVSGGLASRHGHQPRRRRQPAMPSPTPPEIAPPAPPARVARLHRKRPRRPRRPTPRLSAPCRR